MTQKTKPFRPAPLLEPPSSERHSFELFPQDVSLMQDKLQAFRDQHHGHDILEMMHFMKRLGITPQITNQDREDIDAHLSDYRKKGDGLAVAKMYVRMMNLGETPEIPKSDRRLFLKCLKSWRGKNDWTIGDSIADMHLALRRFGMPHDVNDLDRNAFLSRFELFRVNKDFNSGLYLASFHTATRELGEEYGITPVDSGEFKRQYIKYSSRRWANEMLEFQIDMVKLGEGRPLKQNELDLVWEELQNSRQTNDGYGLAKILYLTKELGYTVKTTNTAPEMPPLKKF